MPLDLQNALGDAESLLLATGHATFDLPEGFRMFASRPSGSCKVSSRCHPLPQARPRHQRPCVSQRVAKLEPDGPVIKCLFSDGAFVTISRFLAGFVHLSDEIEFDSTAVDANRELRVVQNTSRRPRELYSAPIGYVTQPKPDKRGEYFVRAAVTGSRLGVRHIHLPNAVVRDYFYFSNRRRPAAKSRLFLTCWGPSLGWTCGSQACSQGATARASDGCCAQRPITGRRARLQSPRASGSPILLSDPARRPRRARALSLRRLWRAARCR